MAQKYMKSREIEKTGYNNYLWSTLKKSGKICQEARNDCVLNYKNIKQYNCYLTLARVDLFVPFAYTCRISL